MSAETVPRSSIAVLAVLLFASTAVALPPLETVLADLERFRAASGDVSATGRLDYAGINGDVELVRRFGEAPLLTVEGVELLADWRQSELDVVLRVVGAVLGSDDLNEALTLLGRPLTEQIATLAFLDDDVCWVIGGELGANTARLWVERETYRLRRVEAPMPAGMLTVSLDEYTLASGWFPSQVVVRQADREVFRLQLESLSPL